jgi:hypothetical protein
MKLKAIKAADLEKEMVDVCPICLDHHKKKNCWHANCGHEFGDECLGKWIETKRQAREIICCPVCRSQITKTQAFRPWGKKQPRRPVAVVEQEGEEEDDSMEVVVEAV